MLQKAQDGVAIAKAKPPNGRWRRNSAGGVGVGSELSIWLFLVRAGKASVRGQPEMATAHLMSCQCPSCVLGSLLEDSIKY